MSRPYSTDDVDYDNLLEPVQFDFSLRRRGFVQTLGAGLLVSAVAAPALAQRRGGGRRRRTPVNVSARIHVGENGVVTVLAGKTEMGQGARTELAQAAAEELRLPTGQLQMILADTARVPNDGNTAGSRTTPSTVPAVRRAAAVVRQTLASMASEQWGVDAATVEVRDGRAMQSGRDETLGYDDLARDQAFVGRLGQPAADDVQLTPIAQWKVLGKSETAPNRRDFVVGAHKFPSDYSRPGMLYGRVLRPGSRGATLKSVDLASARSMEGVQIVQDGEFIGVAAPSMQQADAAIEAIAATAEWDSPPQPSSEQLFEYLRENADGGVPTTPFSSEMQQAVKALEATYQVAYVQHAPLEPRVALAEWNGESELTVWTGTQNPFGYRGELARAFRIAEENVRVVVPDFGSAYGGKHTGETAIEAAQIARAVGKPVLLRWSREEEFTWAYFRPAALIDLASSLDADQRITSWYHINVNSGGSAVETPYEVAQSDCRSIRTNDPPLRHGSYRALASTANAFARESFMDELADAAGIDPLQFRQNHLGATRLRDVLEDAAERFGWTERAANPQEGRGVGLACATEKGSFVAACVEVEINRRKEIEVLEVCQTFECGKVLNPDNLLRQVQGAIIQGLGPALSEEIEFADGKVLNAAFRRYKTPRFEMLPKLDIRLLDRPDLPSVGGGETPLIAVAPAIANAVFHAAGVRVRQMPIKLA